MVDILKEAPRDIAYDVFSEKAKTEDRLTVDKGKGEHKGCAYLTKGYGHDKETLVSGHPDTGLIKVDTPAYCISCFDNDYQQVAEEAARQVEEEFKDIEEEFGDMLNVYRLDDRK